MEFYYYILIALAAVIVGFIVFLNVNALLCVKKRGVTDAPRKTAGEAENNEYVRKLQRIISCRTVFSDDYDDTEFKKLRDILAEEFPLVHKNAELQIFGTGCLIYKLKGENQAKNVMLMSHHDVVEAEGEWRFPPFSGEVADGCVWGRGTLDTKTPLFGILQAAEEILKEGGKFPCNIWIGSSNNEEICGDGIPEAVEYFKQNNIRFDCVIDEGGAITSDKMPSVKIKSAMIAVHEKGRHTVKCVARTQSAGHQGLNPVKGNAISRMCRFICEAVDADIFKCGFYPEVERTFITHAPYMSYPYRLLFANFKYLKGLLRILLPKVNSSIAAMMQTGLYFTTIHGGTRHHIQAKEVTAYAFFRCVREDILKGEMEKFNEIAKKYNIETTPELADYCRPSDDSGAYYKLMEKIINQNFPDVIVAPFLLTAGSDARHFTDIADCILRFAPLDIKPEQFNTIHSSDENVSVSSVGECVCFYKDYIKALETL